MLDLLHQVQLNFIENNIHIRPLHIANALGANNIIAIFGPTSAQITGPFPLKNVILLQKDVGCKIPCYEVKCRDNRCMKAITPDDIVEQAKKIRENK